MVSLLIELDSMFEEESRQEMKTCTFNSKPFITVAEGMYRNYIEDRSMSTVTRLLINRFGSNNGPSFKIARELLMEDFRSKLKRAKTSSRFISFIRTHFEAGVKLWN